MSKQGLYKPAIENIDKIISTLRKQYPEADDTSLNFENPFQLLIATILAAQSTDKQVNKVTPDLFSHYRTPSELAQADISVLEQEIRSTGFFRNKAKSIKNCAGDIIKKFNGQVPSNIDDLTSLSGVGRKTANVVLANAFSGSKVDSCRYPYEKDCCQTGPDHQFEPG
ncbi:MAG: endonuclease III [Actinomycetota bacterium]|nr:endonuclease III [Actinomycetota bacterium]